MHITTSFIVLFDFFSFHFTGDVESHCVELQLTFK